MSIAAFVISCVALGVSIAAAVFAWRQARAAEESTEIERERRDEELADAERNRVRWTFEDVDGKGKYWLTNAGTESAFAVSIDVGEVRHMGELEYDEFPAGQSEPLMIAPLFGSGTDRIVITWHHRPDRSDERQRRELLL